MTERYNALIELFNNNNDLLTDWFNPNDRKKVQLFRKLKIVKPHVLEHFNINYKYEGDIKNIDYS